MSGRRSSPVKVNAFASGTGGAEVTLNDTAANEYDALWIGTAGDGTLRITTANGTLLNFVGVPTGMFEMATSIVHTTGTGVSDVVGITW